MPAKKATVTVRITFEVKYKVDPKYDAAHYRFYYEDGTYCALDALQTVVERQREHTCDFCADPTTKVEFLGLTTEEPSPLGRPTST